jgi:hypothetical protein
MNRALSIAAFGTIPIQKLEAVKIQNCRFLTRGM